MNTQLDTSRYCDTEISGYRDDANKSFVVTVCGSSLAVPFSKLQDFISGLLILGQVNGVLSRDHLAQRPIPHGAVDGCTLA